MRRLQTQFERVQRDLEDFGVLCRVPPPGGHGTFCSDALCQSFVVYVPFKEKEGESTKVQPEGLFLEMHQRKFSLKDKMEAKKRQTSTVGARFIRVLDHIVRFSHNSIGAALASAFACKLTAHDPSISREQSRLLTAQATKFSEVALSLVDSVYPRERKGTLCPRFTSDLERHPEQRNAEAAIELALDLHDLEFTHHRTTEDFTHAMWTGEFDVLVSKLKPIRASDTRDWRLLQAKVKATVRALSDIDLILSPAVRFITAFVCFVMLLISHHIVVFEVPTADMNGQLTDPETIFIFISIGFFLGECEEVIESISTSSLNKYFRDGWNLVDW